MIEIRTIVLNVIIEVKQKGWVTKEEVDIGRIRNGVDNTWNKVGNIHPIDCKGETSKNISEQKEYSDYERK